MDSRLLSPLLKLLIHVAAGVAVLLVDKGCYEQADSIKVALGDLKEALSVVGR